MDDLLSEFLAETNEALDTLDSELVALEQRPDDPALLGDIFRLIHTIKGTCGFLELRRLELVAHAAEDVLGLVRDGELQVTPHAVSLILAAIDRIKLLIAHIGEHGVEPEGDDEELTGELKKVAAGKNEPVAAAAPEATPPQAAAVETGDLMARLGAASALDAACEIAWSALAFQDRPANAPELATLEMQFEFLTRLSEALAPTDPDEEGFASFHKALLDAGWRKSDIEFLHEELCKAFLALEVPDADVDQLKAFLSRFADPECREPANRDEDLQPAPASFDAVSEAAPPADSSPVTSRGDAARAGISSPPSVPAPQTLRVNINVLEDLMTMVSELVLTRNQLLQIQRSSEDTPFTAPLQRLNQVTSELQEAVMMTRMQPIGNAWGKLPRLIRDLSQELGKQIELVMSGEETELDRQILESIRDPLTHMVRNSADHGIEAPEVRTSAGKAETGTIRLTARHEGGHIIVQVSDDGKGLALDNIRKKVIEKGLATEAQLETMSEQQIQQFIFRPGFSTAAAVTNVSGRGVGMDVVRSNIEKIGGVIEFQSIEGKGSSFTIKIPLTLAIVSALIVECSGQRFAMPQNSVLELVRISSTSLQSIEKINGRPVYRLRDKLLPLVSLSELLQMDEAETPEQSDSTYVVVSQVGTFNFGIIVDRVFDTEEIVVKPVSKAIRRISLFSGTTILGDGQVIMILDPNGIASMTNATPVEQATAQQNSQLGKRGNRNAVSMLIFEAGDGVPRAVPVSLVARLEEIDISAAEKVGGRTVVQYRGSLMPLIDFEGRPAKVEGRRPILVFVDGNRMLGLVVDRIVDIIDVTLDLQLAGAERPGILGSAIVAGRATDVIDTVHYLQSCDERWFAAETDKAFGEADEKHILLVEDSAFFRNLLTPLLTIAGYHVSVAEDGKVALEAMSKGRFDLVVSDIEMPGLNGFELVQRLRDDARWNGVPVIALSSHANPRDIEKGLSAGFSEYVTKHDPKALIGALSRAFGSGDGARDRKEVAA